MSCRRIAVLYAGCAVEPASRVHRENEAFFRRYGVSRSADVQYHFMINGCDRSNEGWDFGAYNQALQEVFTEHEIRKRLYQLGGGTEPTLPEYYIFVNASVLGPIAERLWIQRILDLFAEDAKCHCVATALNYCTLPSIMQALGLREPLNRYTGIPVAYGTVIAFDRQGLQAILDDAILRPECTFLGDRSKFDVIVRECRMSMSMYRRGYQIRCMIRDYNDGGVEWYREESWLHRPHGIPHGDWGGCVLGHDTFHGRSLNEFDLPFVKRSPAYAENAAVPEGSPLLVDAMRVAGQVYASVLVALTTLPASKSVPG